MYCLFLGAGLGMGLAGYNGARHVSIVADDYTCASTHDPNIWYRATVPPKWGKFSLHLNRHDKKHLTGVKRSVCDSAPVFDLPRPSVSHTDIQP